MHILAVPSNLNTFIYLPIVIIYLFCVTKYCNLTGSKGIDMKEINDKTHVFYLPTSMVNQIEKYGEPEKFILEAVKEHLKLFKK